jgi:hypothetical protein
MNAQISTWWIGLAWHGGLPTFHYFVIPWFVPTFFIHTAAALLFYCMPNHLSRMTYMSRHAVTFASGSKCYSLVGPIGLDVLLSI